MQSPVNRYLDRPVGQQLLPYYARRDAIRHATPLLPIGLADIGRFFHALLGRTPRRHCRT